MNGGVAVPRSVASQDIRRDSDMAALWWQQRRRRGAFLATLVEHVIAAKNVIVLAHRRKDAIAVAGSS